MGGGALPELIFMAEHPPAAVTWYPLAQEAQEALV